MFYFSSIKKNKYLYYIIIFSAFTLEKSAIYSQNISKVDSINIFRLYDKAAQAIDTNPNIALLYVQKGFNLSQKKDFKLGLVKGFSSLGDVYWRKGELSKTINYYKKAIEIAKENNFMSIYSSILLSLSGAYSEISIYDKSFFYCIKALDIRKNEKDSFGIALCYNSIANILYQQKDYKVAKNYCNKATNIYKSLNNLYMYAASIRLGGIIDLQDKKYSQALSALFEAKKIDSQLNKPNSLMYDYLTIGGCYDDLNNTDSAFYFYSKSLELSIKYDAKEIQFSALSNIGEIYLNKNQFDKAEKYFLEALFLNKAQENYIDFKTINENLAKLYIKLGNYKKAYDYQKAYIAANDSVMSKEKTNALQELNIRFQTKEIEDKNMVLQKENDIQKLRLQQKNIFIYVFILVIILLIIISFLFLKQNTLRVQKQKIEIEQKLLRSQMNPHFIFNSLQSIQNFILTNQKEESSNYLTSFSRLMRLFLENSKHELIDLEKEISTINYYLKLQQLRFKNKFIYTLNVDSSIDIDFVFLPPMLLQPFLENTLEHGFKSTDKMGEIRVEIFDKGKELLIELTDNGIGVEKSLALKKDNKSSHKSRALEITKSRLELINQKYKCNISIVIIDLSTIFTEMQGTKITINFPKNIKPS